MINQKQQTVEKRSDPPQSQKWVEYNPLGIVPKKDATIKILKKSLKISKIPAVKNTPIIQKPQLKMNFIQRPSSTNQTKKPAPLQKSSYNPFKLPKNSKPKIKIVRGESPKLMTQQIKHPDTTLDKIINHKNDDKILLKEPETILKMFLIKQCIFVYKQQEIPVCLLSEIIPEITQFEETKLKLKLCAAAETIKFLVNSDRSIVIGHIQYDYSSKNSTKPSLLYELSEQLFVTGQLFAHKYDNGNQVFCLMNKKQILSILQSRKQKLNIEKTGMIIKEWVDNDYLKWWGENQEWAEHGLFYLIFYKQPIINKTPFKSLTLEQPKKYPQLKNYNVAKPLKNLNTIQQTQQLEPDFNILNSFMTSNPDILQMLSFGSNDRIQDKSQSESMPSYKGSPLSRITEDSVPLFQQQNETEPQNLNNIKYNQENSDLNNICVELEDGEKYQ